MDRLLDRMDRRERLKRWWKRKQRRPGRREGCGEIERGRGGKKETRFMKAETQGKWSHSIESITPENHFSNSHVLLTLLSSTLGRTWFNSEPTRLNPDADVSRLDRSHSYSHPLRVQFRRGQEEIMSQAEVRDIRLVKL